MAWGGGHVVQGRFPGGESILGAELSAKGGTLKSLELVPCPGCAEGAEGEGDPSPQGDFIPAHGASPQLSQGWCEEHMAG